MLQTEGNYRDRVNFDELYPTLQQAHLLLPGLQIIGRKTEGCKLHIKIAKNIFGNSSTDRNCLCCINRFFLNLFVNFPSVGTLIAYKLSSISTEKNMIMVNMMIIMMMTMKIIMDKTDEALPINGMFHMAF